MCVGEDKLICARRRFQALNEALILRTQVKGEAKRVNDGSHASATTVLQGLRVRVGRWMVFWEMERKTSLTQGTLPSRGIRPKLVTRWLHMSSPSFSIRDTGYNNKAWQGQKS